MSPPEAIKIVKKEETVKTGGVGKIKTEVRRYVSKEIKKEVKPLQKSYYLNKAKQVNKVIIKNKAAEPVSIKHKVNDVQVTYSPAVFREAVLVVVKTLKEGATFETGQIDIKVKKVRPSVDGNGIKTDDLITLEVKSKLRIEKPVIQQMHVYYTNQSFMVQGQRLVGGIKGFKITVEDFLQPAIEKAMKKNRENIKDTKKVLDNADLVSDERKSEDDKEILEPVELSNFNCEVCDGKFKVKYKLDEHRVKMHTHQGSHLLAIEYKKEENKTEANDKEGQSQNLPPIAQVIKEVSFSLSTAGQLEVRPKKQKEEKYSCNKCDFEIRSKKELETHIQRVHEESTIFNEAQNVIELIKRDMNKPQKDDNMELEYIGLKRNNSTSPKNPKGKTQKKSNTHKQSDTHNQSSKKVELLQVEEDLRIIKEERDELKSDNERLRRKHLQERVQLLSENEKLVNKLKQHEEDAVKAMKAIAEEVKEQTSKLNLKHKEELEKNVTKFEKELTKRAKEGESKIEEIRKEKDKILNDMTQMQKNNTLMEEKTASITRENKIKENLKVFETIKKQCETKHQHIDECINVSSCVGDCTDVSESRKLSSLKQSGSKRTCPQTTPDPKPMFYCDVCTFMTQNKTYFISHMKQHHENKEAQKIIECPQCGFKAMSKERFNTHMKQVHTHTQVTETQNKRRPCAYFGTRNGCKKGNECPYDHSTQAQNEPVIKVPKLCKDKETCAWKPRCRYVHPEEGEALPVRGVREGPREGRARICFYPTNCPRGGPVAEGGSCSYFHPNPANPQDFVSLDYSQPPPGWSSPPPPAQVRETRGAVSVIVPNRMCLIQYPNLERIQTR